MRKAERKAIEDGYTFSGVYEFFKSDAKEKAAKKREEGYLAKVIAIPGNRLSRNPKTGYSVYTKATPKKLIEKKEKKRLIEKKRQEDLEKIEKYLMTRTGKKLIEILKKEMGNEQAVLNWARKESIT